MKPSKIVVPKQKTSEAMRRLIEISRKESVLLGDVQEMMLKRVVGEGRATNVLHPSEICKPRWCPRSSYYALCGYKARSEKIPSWQMEMIFDEGHTIHEKWQKRAWDLGTLEGMFKCIYCDNRWWDKAPHTCSLCGARREFLKYAEVPVFNEEYGIGGHADGVVKNKLMEIKSLARGTVLFEAPGLLEEFTYKVYIGGRKKEFIDWDGLWASITYPFKAHQIQAAIYSFCTGIPEVFFIYECKWNQKPKEFLFVPKREQIDPILKTCKDVLHAKETRTPPPCPFKGCAECKRYEDASGQPLSSPFPKKGHRRRLVRSDGRPIPVKSRVS